eukprot:gnl/Trimastix_PCT/1360.p1 GENE.gnl/Trimastix_PCT/1360~~gnl/Trimastix_PCT/1360.p1  ORF type:complete len:550 (+),score=27.59 gnl/Trimastix_PCT/1360:12-1661(+)
MPLIITFGSWYSDEILHMNGRFSSSTPKIFLLVFLGGCVTLLFALKWPLLGNTRSVQRCPSPPILPSSPLSPPSPPPTEPSSPSLESEEVDLADAFRPFGSPFQESSAKSPPIFINSLRGNEDFSTLSLQTNLSSADAVSYEPFIPRSAWNALLAHKKLQEDILNGKQPGRYVIWKIETMPCGFANRILGITSSYLLAILTNRALIIQDSMITDALDSPRLNWGMPANEAGSRYKIGLGPGTRDDLGCQNQRRHFETNEIIQVESTQYFAPLFTHNPHHRAEILRVLGHSPFVTLARFLFQPKPVVLQAIDQIVKNDFKNNYIIGLQIRPEHLIKPREETNLFFTCSLLRKHALEQQARTTEEKPPVYFVATNVPEVIKQAHAWGKEHGVQVITLGSTSAGKSLPANHAAMADIFLLTRCHEMMITYPKSTFGAFAAGYRGAAPYVVYSGLYKKNLCTRLMVPDPCYHGWHYRWHMQCYSPETHETPEMCNMSNCYFTKLDPNNPIDYDEMLPNMEDPFPGTEGEYKQLHGGVEYPYKPLEAGQHQIEL